MAFPGAVVCQRQARAGSKLPTASQTEARLDWVVQVIAPDDKLTHTTHTLARAGASDDVWKRVKWHHTCFRPRQLGPQTSDFTRPRDLAMSKTRTLTSIRVRVRQVSCEATSKAAKRGQSLQNKPYGPKNGVSCLSISASSP